ncbi:hypothetical protein [Marispirochaeta sp.]|uniref:hypothetical protein n=1 Tax=Marispirochaeta sp. TaxID=2038653 RepID=UPI0029C6BFCD|nr:hypothetical protein [Marispirochaeta sp.]
MNTLCEKNRPQEETPECIEQARKLRKELVSCLNQLEEVDTLFAWWLCGADITIEIEDLLEVVHFYTVLAENLKRELWTLKERFNEILPYINMARVAARRRRYSNEFIQHKN